jgi:hypothetical protein
MDANCNLLGYEIHHWICYTRLFLTPWVIITIFLVTLSSDPPLSCLGAVLWCCLSWMLAADSLAVINWLFTLKQISRTGYSTPCREVHASIAMSWLLKKQLTVDSICYHRDVFSFLGNMIISLAIRVFRKLLRRSAEIRTRPLNSNVPIWSIVKSVTLLIKCLMFQILKPLGPHPGASSIIRRVGR